MELLGVTLIFLTLPRYPEMLYASTYNYHTGSQAGARQISHYESAGDFLWQLNKFNLPKTMMVHI